MTLPPNPDVRLDLSYDSLAGLSIGDALGAQYFVPGNDPADLLEGRVPDAPWEWTDDTHMACTVVAELRDHGGIEQDRIAAAFADRCDPYRGYGGGAVVILHRIRDGVPWRRAAADAFDGRGSFGNGAAMRVAPLGAWFAGETDRAAEQAIRASEVTHSHPEAVIGGLLVAVAAANAAAARLTGPRPSPAEFLDALEPYAIDSQVTTGLRKARSEHLLGASVGEAAWALGNGSRVSAQDTVPFALWVAATHLHDFPAAITACVQAGGDVDTTAAIVGGIVAAYTGTRDGGGVTGVPAAWLASREPLPVWVAR